MVSSAISINFLAGENLNCGEAPDLPNTMPQDKEILALTIKFWTLVVICCYYDGLPFLWKFGFVMALIDWLVEGLNAVPHI